MRTREQEVEPLINLSEITEVELRILKRMREFTIGEHASRFHGSGFDFVGLREWQAGDRFSSIDWPQSSLTNFSPLIIREFEQPSTSSVIMVADRSLSTRCGIDGVPIATTIEFNQKGGAGEDALVWVPAGLNADGWSALQAPKSDVRFDVAVSNVLIGGVPRTFSYTVNVFDPALPGPDTVEAAITGAAEAKLGVANPYAFNAVPRADGYRYQEARVVPFNTTETADDGGKSFTATTSGGYETTTKAPATFRLAHSQPSTQSLTYNRVLVPTATSKVTFRARVGHSAAGQIPKLQAKIEGSGVWRDIWTHPKGAGTTNESTFTNYSAPLGAFVGRGVKLRFAYEHHGGSYFSTTGAATSGFFFDDVTVTGAEELTAPIEHDVVGTAFSFVPSTTAKYALRVRPRFYGKYFLDYGPVKLVAASTTAPTPPATTPTPVAIPTPPTPMPMPSALPWAFPWPVPILTPPGTPAPPTMPAVLPIPDLEAPLPFPDLGKALPLPFPLPK
jgi:hypothetical protein